MACQETLCERKLRQLQLHAWLRGQPMSHRRRVLPTGLNHKRLQQRRRCLQAQAEWPRELRAQATSRRILRS